MARGKLTATDGCAHQRTCLEDQSESIHTSDGRYKVLSFVLMAKLVYWHNFAHNNEDEVQFVTKVGLLPFLLINGANLMVALYMELVKEFINVVDVNNKTTITTRVCSQLVEINVALIQHFLKLQTGSTIEPLVKVQQPPDYQALLRDYRVVDAKYDEGYSISKCHPKFRPHLEGMIVGLSFKHRMTYISNETFAILLTAKTISTSGDGTWIWA